MIKRKVKNIMRLIPPINWLLKYRKYVEDKNEEVLRTPYINKLRIIFTNDTSIISSNCFAVIVLRGE